jgi:hypothetical protein
MVAAPRISISAMSSAVVRTSSLTILGLRAHEEKRSATAG